MPPSSNSLTQKSAETLAAVVVLTLAALFVFRGALTLYFAQDDFGGLARAAGILPRHASPWRYVSVQAFMDVLHPWFGVRPLPYHAVTLGLHALNAAFLFALLAPRFGRPAALVGATFFVTHPAHFTALYWLSARSDLLATTFALPAVALAMRGGRERWLAVPAYLLALLSKESALTVPAVVALLRPRGARAGWLLAALFLLSGVYLIYILVAKQGDIRVDFVPGAAYAFDFGTGALRNLLTYTGWTADLAMARPGLRFVDREDPGMFPFAALALIVAATAGLWPPLRSRGWWTGLACFLLLLLPALPLQNHAYHYYLYLPLTAAALCVAALADALLGMLARRATPRGPRPFELAALACLALTWNGSRLVGQMEHRPSPVFSGMRGDPIVDRARVAERLIESLHRAPIPAGTDLVLLFRERLALARRVQDGSGEPAPPAHETYLESNVRAAVFGGVGVRALVPAARTASFALSPGSREASRRFAVYAPTGEAEVFDGAGLDSLLASSWPRRW